MEKISNRQPENKNEQDKDRSKKISEALKGIIAKGLIILSPLWAGSKEQNIIDDAPTKPKDPTEQQAPSAENPSIPNTELKPKAEIKEEDLKIYEFCEKYIDEANNASKLPKEADLPPQLLLAMALLESGYGESELAREANNFFGNTATEEEWQGEVYEKLTTEYIDKDKRVKYEDEKGYKFLEDKGDKLKVEYFRKFRKYPDAQASFNDTATNKIFFKKNDGTYRYKEAVEYLVSGGKDAKRVAELIGPNSEGRSAWASDPEWTEKVKNIIGRIDSICVSNDMPIDEDTSEVAPKTSNVIDISKIDFSELKDASDSPVIERMQAAFREVTLERFDKYKSEGITKISREQYIEFLEGQPGRDRTPAEEYEKAYSQPLESFDYIIYHIMSIGRGSEKITLKEQLQSWFNSRSASTQWLMSDNEPVDVWQISPTKAGNSAWHIAYGIKDSGREGREDASNKNSVGIEVQANNIFDVKQDQFETLLYWTADLLIESGKVNKEMSDSEIDAVIEKMVIGHGQNPEKVNDDSGLEFGYDYVKPIQEALKQLVKAELRR